MLTPFDLMLLALAAVAWPLCLFRPGWTRALVRAAARRPWTWAAVAAGLLLVALADPVLPQMPGRAAADAWTGLFRPELGRRLTPPVAGVLLLALPLLADARLAPGGLPALAPAARRLALAGCAWLGIALAPLLIARSVPAVWASTLGGEMHPSLRALLVVAGGADPAGSGRSVPDAGLPALLWLMAAGAVLALAGLRLTAARWPSAAARIALAWGWGLLVGLAGWALRVSAPEVAAGVAVPTFGAAAVALWAVSRRRGPDGTGELVWRLALTGVVLLAFQLRWGFLVQNPGWGIPLSMDAQSYYDEGLYLDRLLVDRRTNLFALFFSGSTYFREPLFVYLMHNWLHLVGAQEIHAVYLTVLASTVWVGVSAVAVRLLLGRGAGLLAALLLAIDAVWYRNAAVGLREEVTGVLLGLLLIVLWAARSGRWGLYWLAPFLAGAAAVTRLDALPFALFILVWAAVAQRWPVRRAVAVLALLAVVLVPTLAGYGRSRGDVAPASTEIATNNWREVFKDRLGQPGFEPDRRVTATEFVFRYFTPSQWVRYTLGGYARIYGEEVFVSHYYLLANGTAGWGRYLGLHSARFVPLLFLAGTVGLLFQWRRWRRTWLVPALCIVGVMPPIGFVAGVPGHPALYQARYAYMVAPFAAATVAWALVAGGGWLAGRLARGRALDRSAPAPAQPVNGAQPAQPAEGGEAGRGLALRRSA
ncbi:MAG TPA: hypothetical protein VNK05_07530 [Chloroflexota bacterium]|nr:hypothetical protein [Chloroflexota bacterium]